MKNLFPVILLIISPLFGENQFNRGVNLTNWMQTTDVRKINFTKYDKSDFENIQLLGCDVIRLPIRLNDMTSGSPDYTVDPLFYYFLDQIVDWAEELDMNLILDNHTFSSDVDTDSTITDPLISVWTQMAEHYRTRSELIFYEVLNEPHEIDGTLWAAIQDSVIQAIREVDSVHTLIVGGHNWNSYSTLASLPEYDDDNLIYTFHFYDPFIFTHQGASWTDPSMEPLADVPFPYVSTEMPAVPSELVGTWIESSLNNYNNDGTIAKVKELIDIADTFQSSRNVPIFCGELGVYNINCSNDDRVVWYQIVSDYFAEKNIPWTMWDYQGAFGLFEKDSDEMFDHDLNIPLLEALDFNIPEQTEFQIIPDSADITLYSDYLAKTVETNYYSGDNFDLYHETSPYVGRHSIQWSNPGQYESLPFDFVPDRDFTYINIKNYCVDFWIKSNNTDLTFDIRFTDTDTDDPDDHPWRMRYTINNTDVNWNGTWQHIQIPLSEFSEHGAWDDNTWFNPEGKFDWSAIDAFYIVSEHASYTETDIYFDEIQLLNPDENAIDKPQNVFASEIQLNQNYPNPFNPNTTICYEIPQDCWVSLKIYNFNGQLIETLVNEFQLAGSYNRVWNASRASSSIYFYQIKALGESKSNRCILIK